MKFDFNDINLIPQKCIVESRSECNTSVRLGNIRFRMPIVPANMECVINENIAENLAKNGYFYILHRFDTDHHSFIKRMKDQHLVSSISIGVNKDSYDLIMSLVDHGLTPDYVCIDIAHGHSIKMERMVKWIKSNYPSIFVIAGNISTPEAVLELESWGADATKVGIGPGSACTTYPATGFGSRNCQASIVKDCCDVAQNPVIADGGVRVPGDITKSIVLGATMVMVGGMLSGFIDSPGHVLEYDNKKYKEFWGSASQFQSGKSSRIEGIKNLIEFKDKTIQDELVYLEECLQSSISYGGGNNLQSLSKVKFLL